MTCSIPKQRTQRLKKVCLCVPSVDVQSSEEGGSGSSGEHLETTLGVLDPTDAQHIDQKVEPVHQKVAEERALQEKHPHISTNSSFTVQCTVLLLTSQINTI